MKYTVSNWPLLPMEPVSRESAFDNSDYVFQVKWDGVRVLAYIYPEGNVRLFNRRLNERTKQYPEVVEALKGLPGGTVLDGEIIAFGLDGKPDFPRVLQRDLVRSPAKADILMKRIQVCYMVFDILWYNGNACYDLPLFKRQEILGEISFGSGIIHKVESIPAQGRALFEAVKAEGLEGIVSKKTDSTYRIGKKSDMWQKIKSFRQLTAVAGGYLLKEPAHIRSLLIGILQEEGIRYIGSAASGVKQRQWQELVELFSKISGPCPFINPSSIKGTHWVQPLLEVQVQFLEYTSAGIMRTPSILGFPNLHLINQK